MVVTCEVSHFVMFPLKDLSLKLCAMFLIALVSQSFIDPHFVMEQSPVMSNGRNSPGSPGMSGMSGYEALKHSSIASLNLSSVSIGHDSNATFSKVSSCKR